MQFIESNKDKAFSSDIKLGNMLPLEYETEKGEFLFNKFSKEYLMKLFTYAENIVVYVTPFVLNVNIQIVLYDFGKNCYIEKNELVCGLKDKPTIYILNRICHYDLIYAKDYFNKYSNYLSSYAEVPEEDKVLKTILIENFKVTNKKDDISVVNNTDTADTENINTANYENEAYAVKKKEKDEFTSTISTKPSENYETEKKVETKQDTIKLNLCDYCHKKPITLVKASLCGKCCFCTADCFYNSTVDSIKKGYFLKKIFYVVVV